MKSIVKTETGYDVINTLTGRDYIMEVYGVIPLIDLLVATHGKVYLLEDRRALLELDLTFSVGQTLAIEDLPYWKHSAIVACVRDLYPDDEIFKKLIAE